MFSKGLWIWFRVGLVRLLYRRVAEFFEGEATRQVFGMSVSGLKRARSELEYFLFPVLSVGLCQVGCRYEGNDTADNDELDFRQPIR
jgi:hypothetical protein